MACLLVDALQLTSLDMEVVSEESKAFANTVFLKKSMYYNMRSRIVKRHAGHVIRKVSKPIATTFGLSL